MTFELTVPSGTVASDLADFPVRVDLSHMPSGWWSQVSTHGSGAIRVRESGVDLPRDVVAADTGASTGTLYFKADLAAASDNVFTIDVVPGETEPAATDPIGRNAVWSDYQFFIDFLGGAVDRAGKATVTLQGSATVTSDGWLDCGAKVGNAYVSSIGANPNNWSCGAVSTSTSTTGTRVLLSLSAFGTTDDRTSLQQGSGLSTWASFAGTSTVDSGVGGAQAAMKVGRGASRTIYANGVNAGSATIAAEPDTTPVMYIGAEDSSFSQRWAGKINRPWLLHVQASAAWFAATYDSWESPATFYSVAEVSERPLAGAIAAVSDVSGALTVGHVLSGAVASTSDVSGSFSIVGQVQDFAGTVVVVSGVSGDLTEPFVMFVPPRIGAGLRLACSNTVDAPLEVDTFTVKPIPRVVSSVSED